MTSPIDAQVLWQQGLDQQALWSQWIQQQTAPSLKNTLEQIQAASTLHQEVAQKILPQLLAEAPNPAALEQCLGAIQDTMSNWAQRQQVEGIMDTVTAVFQAQIQQWQAIQQAMQDYQRIAQRYKAALEQLNQLVFTAFKANMLHEAPKAASLQAIIDQWGEQYERAYIAWTQSAEYQALYAELVHAGIHLKVAVQDQLKPLLQWLNIPSQQDVQLVAERYHELRRAHLELREQFEYLTEQVALLKKA
ncbi:poly(R)-hydroxyalkanoic acid synthase subunit PhaE [Thiofilum flexile]|uniref:poly(R)-hydroxyalkanoic acid synthase subunit PhaE n=1 Tax=Thiofilum flexile TaxID=125627 RepID=UPI000371CE0C|nr:poly(R)-hydroxyalkanoic acid synthase subunit PhaE [Thiofilum flexile]